MTFGLGSDRALRRRRPLRTTSTAGTPGFTHTSDPQALAAWPRPVFPVSVPRSGDCLLDSDDDDGGRKRQFNGLLTQVNVIEVNQELEQSLTDVLAAGLGTSIALATSGIRSGSTTSLAPDRMSLVGIDPLRSDPGPRVEPPASSRVTLDTRA